MTRFARRELLAFALGSPLVALASRAGAQAAWPSKPIHIMVPYGPGGAADTVCRALFARVSEILKQPIIIENRTGGNTVVAASVTLQAPADGYVFLVNSSQLLVNPILMTDVPFDFRTAFVPITKMSAYPQVLAVRRDFPAQTLEEFVAYAKANPEKVTYGTPPGAGMGQMAGELFQRRMGIKLEHIPYRLATEAARDVSGGTLESVILTLSTIKPALEGGRVRILAVTSVARSPALPDVPTFAEKGMPGFNMDDWNGLFAAKGVPDAVIQQMQAAIAEATRDPAVIARLTPLGTVLVGDTREKFTEFLDQQRELLAQLIKDANIKLG